MILLIVFAFLVVHMFVIWLWYCSSNNPSVVDVGWATGLTLSGLIYLSQNFSAHNLVFALALLAWGIRLGGYLWWTRIRPHHVDKRYTALSSSWKINKPVGFLLNFQLQGIFIFIVSLCWYFTGLNARTNFSFLDILGLILFTTALILEAEADWQLYRFKKENPGQVCAVHLWRFSRHPNCFFEWLIWCSFSIFALSSPQGWLSIISPLALFMIMFYITIPITEAQSLKSRGDEYRKYQAKTPKFFPRFKI